MGALNNAGVAGNLRARTRPSYVNTRNAVTTSEQISIPADARIVVMSGDLPFYVAFGSNPTATPSSEVDDGTGNEIVHPASPIESRTFQVTPGEKIAVAAGTAAKVSATFYQS